MQQLVLTRGPWLRSFVEALEPSLAVLGVLSRLVGTADQLLDSCTLRARIARRSGVLAHAVSAIHDIKQLVAHGGGGGGGGGAHEFAWRVEEARVLWAQGHTTPAIVMVRSIVRKLRPELSARVHPGTTLDLPRSSDTSMRVAALAQALCLAAEWLAASGMEHSQVRVAVCVLPCPHPATLRHHLWVPVQAMIEGCVSESAMYHSSLSDRRGRATAWLALAQLSDRRFTAIDERLKSAEWKQSMDVHKRQRQRARALASQVKELEGQSKDVLRSHIKSVWAEANRQVLHVRCM